MLTVDLLYIAVIVLKYIPYTSRDFIMEGYWILSKALSAANEMIMWFPILSLFMLWITFIDVGILSHLYILGQSQLNYGG